MENIKSVLEEIKLFQIEATAIYKRLKELNLMKAWCVVTGVSDLEYAIEETYLDRKLEVLTNEMTELRKNNIIWLKWEVCK